MSQAVLLATGGYDHKIRFWEATSGLCSKVIRFSGSQVNCIEISPDKMFTAGGGNPRIHLFDVNGREDSPMQTFEGHANNVTELGFQRDGKWLYSCSEDGSIKIWDLRTPIHQRNYNAQSPVNTVILHPNQTELISGDQNGCLRVWDLVANACRSVIIPMAETPLRSISISTDGDIVAVGSHKGRMFIYTPNANKDLQLFTEYQAHNEYLLKCVVSPDNSTVVTTSADRSAKLWSTSSWNLTRTLAQHHRWVWDAVFSADSSYMVTASSDQCGKLWDLRSGEVIRNYVGHNLAVTCVALNDSSI
mmetsp:Transcript_5310/g.5464  ORF Transcript_5310/g.5464 Transcript_5310/m.5464 type:complete len:304 (-) Transcript_5310:200-1111(-)|eukprot:CAMPEP_0182417512 /NCGR_PEP_ID=MMETSP1167-20130531/1993_1 /TAXON_ID=2988 /ORGANISM="Mallomonas Sp, Strain CCMP3275" /LENGTH=303 /DNA_ID=CAMNT_0024591141 /DNA_START=186 /DNA_END=1097 /DNA_ORIENTATION=+